MDARTRIEQSLAQAIGLDAKVRRPTRFDCSAMRYAVFPGGARIRPRLCLAVARACAEDQPALAARPPHPASRCCTARRWSMTICRVSTTRRRGAGRPSVHKAFGERIAVLTGDALIVLAFQALAALRAPLRTRGLAV